MNENMPRTPFSTHLSGSARETEIRIRNIFSGPKKRPPLPFLILMFAIAIFCGNLVSCRQRPPEPSLVMETQYYDSYGNYVEIPALALPSGQENEAVDAINTALNNLRGGVRSTRFPDGNGCLGKSVPVLPLHHRPVSESAVFPVAVYHRPEHRARVLPGLRQKGGGAGVRRDRPGPGGAE